MTEFESEIRNLSEVEDLKYFLENNYDNQGWGSAYHYTNLNSLYNIFNGKSIKLSDISETNDVLEKQYAKDKEKYFFCLSRGRITNFDNFGMWGMYGHLRDEISDKEKTNDEKYSKKIGVKICFPKKELIQFVKDSNIFMHIMGYASFMYDSVSRISICSYKTDNEFTIDRNLAGYIKDNSWSYEKELRLSVDLQKSKNCKVTDKGVFLPLSNQLLKSLKVYPSPLYSVEECKKIFDNLCKTKMPEYYPRFEDNFYYKNYYSGQELHPAHIKNK